jgi:nucleotide-binding universal stress UspA family protein
MLPPTPAWVTVAVKDSHARSRAITHIVTGLVIRAASRPVLAIPHTDSELRPLQEISKILVPTDCSPYSKRVVDYAFRLKQFIGCELFLLYVIEFSNAIRFGIRQGYFTDAVSKTRVWAKNQLENLTPYPFVKDKSVHWVIEEGPVSDNIVKCADAYDADLVILGAHGYNTTPASAAPRRSPPQLRRGN